MADDQSTLPRGLGDEGYSHAPKSYGMSGKIMLSAIVILFSAVLLILLTHICARCFFLRRRRRHPNIHLDHHRNTPSSSLGLDVSVLKSLPIFVFSSSTTTHDNILECAVCLSEFQENEKGRILPNCNHSFHVDCIDMWFHSHSTCPLCRATVESESSPVSEIRIEIAAADANEGDSSSGLCSSCQNDEETDPSSASSSSSSSSPSSSSSSSSSSSFRKKEMWIEVGTRRSESLKAVEEVEITMASPGLKSPGSRILSLRRILSRERRGGVFCSSSSSVVTEIDLERGEEQKQSQSHQSLSSVS